MPAQNPEPELTRRQAIGLAIFGGLSLAGVGTCVYVSVEREKAALENLKSLLEQNPADGRIAYATGNEIKIYSAKKLPADLNPDETFQVERPVIRLSWTNEHEILFTSKIASANPRGTPKSAERFHDFTIVSEALYKLDTRTGQSTLVFDPYSDNAKALFGDVLQRDADKEHELEAMMNDKEKKGLRIVYGDHHELRIQEIGKSAAGETYLKIKEDWFILSGDARILHRATRIPAIKSDQKESADGRFKIIDSGGSVRFTDAEETTRGIVLAESAAGAAWYQK